MNDTPSVPEGAESRAPDIDAIRDRCMSASPGPWVRGSDGAGNHISTVDDGKYTYRRVVRLYAGTSEEDAEFVAHARTDIVALLGELMRCRAELDKWRNIADDMAAVLREIHDKPLGCTPDYDAILSALAAYNAAKGE